MDWVGQQLAIASKGSVWHDFSRRYLYVTNRQRLEIELLKNILETEAGQRNLETYLQSALHLTKDEVEAILFLDLSFSTLKASPTDTPSLPTPSSPRQISIIAYHTSKSGSPQMRSPFGSIAYLSNSKCRTIHQI
jgi:hypothetical protein